MNELLSRGDEGPAADAARAASSKAHLVSRLERKTQPRPRSRKFLGTVAGPLCRNVGLLVSRRFAPLRAEGQDAPVETSWVKFEVLP
jgi:hypothetical protein